jgi:hypothetical protein
VKRRTSCAYLLSCTTQMPYRKVIRAAGQRATAAPCLAGDRFPSSRTCGTIFKRAVSLRATRPVR